MPRRPKSPYTRVTAVLSSLNASWLQYWYKKVGIPEAERISRESTEFGKAVHGVAEEYLIGTEPKRAPTDREMFCGGLLVKWMREARVQPLEIQGNKAVEIELKSEKHKLMGHPDLVNMFGDDGALWITDWKTSKECRLEYPLQLAAYAMMLEEQYGLVCDDGVIVRVPSDPTATPQFETHEFHNLRMKYLPIFLEGLSVYRYFNGKKI